MNDSQRVSIGFAPRRILLLMFVLLSFAKATSALPPSGCRLYTNSRAAVIEDYFVCAYTGDGCMYCWDI